MSGLHRTLALFNASGPAALATSTPIAVASAAEQKHSEGAEAAVALVERNPYALVLALIPVLTIFGNSMVILAVRREKSLQTVTNYLIVSLASADLLVATLVMFFAVYFEWNSFVWDLGPNLCNLYIGADVALSTASILNLLAISIDRYIAISHPLAYCQIGTKNSRAYLSIALVWAVSIAVAVPVAFGANHIEQEHDCSFTNPVFMIGSSVFSFFVPCLAMIALYAVIFRRLREREKARDMRKRGPTLGVDNALILNALMGGARMARQIAKSHLKDQLLLELSMQTSSFPSPSEEEEEEEEDEPEQSDSSSSHGRHKQKLSSSNQMSSQHHKMSSAETNRRPTFCLMLNGGAGMPFLPLAPMNPLALPRTGLLLEQQQMRPRRPSRHRRRGTALLLRRCNTLPSAVLRRPQLAQEMIGEERMEHSEGAVDEPGGVDTPEECAAAESGPMLGERREEEERKVPQFLADSLERLPGGTTGLGAVQPLRHCSESASQFSLRDCPSFWHDDELSTQRSFGDGMQEELPFIDSPSTPSSSSSGGSSGSTSSMDGRKWSRSAMTDPSAAKARRRLALEGPPRAYSSYCGWPEGVGQVREEEEEEKPGQEEEKPGEEAEEKPKDKEKPREKPKEKEKPEEKPKEKSKEEEKPNEQQGQLCQPQVRLVPRTLVELASPVHGFPPSPCPWLSHGDTASNAKDCLTTTASPHQPVRRVSTAVRPRLSILCPAACQSLPNLLNESRLGSPLPVGKEEMRGGIKEDEEEMDQWLRQMADWQRREEAHRAERRMEVGFSTEHSTSGAGSAFGKMPNSQRSASIGNRSVRISGCPALDLNANCLPPGSAPPVLSSSALPQRNGSCPRSAKSSSHQSPLQRIRNAFRRSLLAAMDEKRRPSRQLLKRATKQMRREQKATVTLAVVLVVFLCCWVPFFALHLSNALCLLSGGQQCVHLLAMFLSTWLGYLNSSLNPLIYTVFDKRFRKAFRDLLACCLGPPGGGGLNRARARQR